MSVKCVDASDKGGTGTGLLTEGKLYDVLGHFGGYFEIRCDDGKLRSKLKNRFKYVSNKGS